MATDASLDDSIEPEDLIKKLNKAEETKQVSKRKTRTMHQIDTQGKGKSP